VVAPDFWLRHERTNSPGGHGLWVTASVFVY
jgi:hypothetical protein